MRNETGHLSVATASWPLIAVAGLAGGLAEVLVIAFYALGTGRDGWAIAAAIAGTVDPSLGTGMFAAVAGLVIHFALSLLVAICFAVTLLPMIRTDAKTVLVTALASLAFIWAINFFIVLPALNPGFLTLVPPATGFISKAMFGLAMSAVFARAPHSREISMHHTESAQLPLQNR